ncbi:dihydrofolate reductase [Streptomyces sp. SAI-126]|uniref:dihydrofolate reductase family protein n=1 Tax=unclassified Streptomyces TaxID=2593676 RepID=UPI00247326DC|nr:dihydrofolate reductase family protein [Streptomyces sp. SAI-119]MDH6455671.1 dihydrofolate reductase [Streptomyces sp. SAI-119]
MSKVYTHMTMSLDGYVADTKDGTGELFGWYDAGEVTVPSADQRWFFQVDANSAEMLRGDLAAAGALVCGRRLFDLANGWNDKHPIGAPVVVVTHNSPEEAAKWPRTTFADGVAEGIARAKEIAGDKHVIIASADIARQALDLGLVDEVCVSLVPVLLGKGIPYFANLTSAPHRFHDPVVIQGKGATHLRYRVRR